MLDRVHHTSGSLLACTIVKLTLCPLLIAPGRQYQLSDSRLQSTMDASQIRNGPFHFWGQVGFKKYVFTYGYLGAWPWQLLSSTLQ